jgi:hypothetical protein
MYLNRVSSGYVQRSIKCYQVLQEFVTCKGDPLRSSTRPQHNIPFDLFTKSNVHIVYKVDFFTSLDPNSLRSSLATSAPPLRTKASIIALPISSPSTCSQSSA